MQAVRVMSTPRLVLPERTNSSRPKKSQRLVDLVARLVDILTRSLPTPDLGLSRAAASRPSGGIATPVAVVRSSRRYGVHGSVCPVCDRDLPELRGFGRTDVSEQARERSAP